MMKRHVEQDDGGRKKMKMIVSEAEADERVASKRVEKYQEQVVASRIRLEELDAWHEQQRANLKKQYLKKQTDLYAVLDANMGARAEAEDTRLQRKTRMDDLHRRQLECNLLWRQLDMFLDDGVVHQSCGKDNHLKVVVLSMGPEPGPGCSGCFHPGIERKTTTVMRKAAGMGSPDKFHVLQFDNPANFQTCSLCTICPASGHSISFDRLCGACGDRVKEEVVARQQRVHAFVTAVSEALGGGLLLDIGNLAAAYYFTKSTPSCFHCNVR